MSDYQVDRIPGKLPVDPDAGGRHQRKRESPPRKRGGDQVSISEETRQRSERQREEGGQAGEQ